MWDLNGATARQITVRRRQSIIASTAGLATEGNGTLSLSGTPSYDRIVTNTDLVVLGGASLNAGQVQFGNGNNRLAVVGQFAGSVDGGAGTDTIAITGGTSAAPVAFGNIANIEGFGMASGYATISGTAALGSVDLTGGRLVGLAGSTIGATQITKAGSVHRTDPDIR